MASKNAIAMTVYNRPQVVFINTLIALGKTGLKDTEIHIADDGSHCDYSPVIESFNAEGKIHLHRFEKDPDAYSIEGFNNPARASNLLLDKIDCTNLFWMSSDVVIQPRTLHAALKLDLGSVVFMPSVMDLDSGMEYLGPGRVTPFGWFYGTERRYFESVRWDEEYMKGIAFEDNDFMARLAVEVGRFVVDLSLVAYHQSHPQTAYSDGNRGFDINRKYTLDKWGGIPWYTQEGCPLVKSMTNVNAQMVLDVKQKVAA